MAITAQNIQNKVGEFASDVQDKAKQTGSMVADQSGDVASTAWLTRLREIQDSITEKLGGEVLHAPLITPSATTSDSQYEARNEPRCAADERQSAGTTHL